MVLLTPSTISVAISSAIVSLFTFLLFLSGYTLQQQTVRSLQQALRQPPPARPIPTLPPQFLLPVTGDDLTENPEVLLKDGASGIEVLTDFRTQSGHQDAFGNAGQQAIIISINPEPRAASEAHISRETPALESLGDENASKISTSAYLLPLKKPSSVCAALLFAKQKQSRPQYNDPPVVLLYPSTWESYPDENTLAALDLLRSAIDMQSSTYGQIILHPVQVSTVWSGAGMIEGQLISEISRSRWDFDRLLYLRLPGMVTNLPSLHNALTNSDVRRSWAPLNSATASFYSVTKSPSILLWTSGRGTLTPRGDLRRLVSELSTSHSNSHANEMEIEAKASNQGSAWISFDPVELEHRRSEKEWFGGLVEGFERGQREVCRGTNLL